MFGRRMLFSLLIPGCDHSQPGAKEGFIGRPLLAERLPGRTPGRAILEEIWSKPGGGSMLGSAER